MSTMNWKIKAETKDQEMGFRQATAGRPSDLFAGIYNDEGYGIAVIDRLGRIDANGEHCYCHDHVADNDEPRAHATTDVEWQSVVACLSAAPEMLSLLRTLASDLWPGEGISAAEAGVMRASIMEVLDKAAPSFRSRVSVTVEVVIETTAGEASWPHNVIMAACEAVRDGEGQIVAHEIVG